MINVESVARSLGRAAIFTTLATGRLIEEVMCGVVSLAEVGAADVGSHEDVAAMERPAAGDCPAAADDGPGTGASTSDADAASHAPWISGVPPIVVGTPSPVFEAKPADGFLGASLRPSVVADGWTSDAFAVRAASVRGLSHQWYGTPRQDDYVLALTGRGWLVAGVADGVSAAAQSHVASSEVLQYLAGWFAATDPQSLDEVDWKSLLEMIRWDLVQKERRVCPDVDQPGRELATTIAFAVVAPRSDGRADVAAVGVGDSGCWLLDSKGYDLKLGGKAEGGEISNSTVGALPLLPEEVSPVTFVLEPGQVLLLGTDGVGDPLGNGMGEVGRLFSDALLLPSLPSLLEFARIVDFSRETFDDDRTLVALRLTGCADAPTLDDDEGSFEEAMKPSCVPDDKEPVGSVVLEREGDVAGSVEIGTESEDGVQGEGDQTIPTADASATSQQSMAPVEACRGN